MAGLTPLPPHITHRTTRLTHLEAHKLLSTFLTTAENDAAYRPDSTLSERGPISGSVGATPNLTLSNLKRILKGLEGKRVGGGLQLNAIIEGQTSGDRKRNRAGDEEPPRNRQSNSLSAVMGDPLPEEQPTLGTRSEGEDDGWQDPTEYEREQIDEDVDLHNEDRDPAANLEQLGSMEEKRDLMEIEIEGTADKVYPGIEEWDEAEKQKRKKVDKEKRKKEKKARSKEEQVKRAQERQKKGAS
jgi:hypothetical protein